MHKTLLSLILCLLGYTALAQANFKALTSLSDDEYNASGTRSKIKETHVLSGNGKSKFNCLAIQYKSRDPQESSYTVFIKGNFKSGIVDGSAELLQLEGIQHQDLFERLQVTEYSLMDLIKEIQPSAYIYYQGDAIKNGEFVEGSYIFKGKYLPEKTYNIHTRFYHLWEISPESQSVELKYERYGSHYHEKMSANDSIIISNYDSGEKHIIYPVLEDIVLGRDVFSLTKGYQRTEIFTTTKFASIGWRRIFKKDKTEMLLQGFARNYNSLPFTGLDLKEKHEYEGGYFYGQMKNAKPYGFGILLNDKFYYEGNFNEKGEFDGYGFYRQFENESKASIKLSISCLGLFKDNRLVSGEVHYNSSYKFVLEADSIYQSQTFPISQELGSVPYPDKVEQGLENPFKLFGQGAKYELRILQVPEARLWNPEDKKLYEEGYFNNDKLDGKGKKLCWTCPAQNGLVYIEADFENGKPNAEYSNAQKELFAAKKKLEMDSLWAEALYPPGSIVSKNGYAYYINQLRRHGKADLIPLPIRKTDATKDGFAKKGLQPYHYYNTGNEVLGSPYFAFGYVEIKYEDLNNYQGSDLKICTFCNGQGSYIHYDTEVVANTDQTTNREVVHEGDYFRISQDVTRYSTTMVNVATETPKLCPQCQGSGCIK
ncbi:MAG: hypothetical protein R2772_07300 [Chitinophagales bacterium]